MMTVTREEFEAADLVLLINEAGDYRYSSNRTAEEAANALEDIAEDIRSEALREELTDHA